MFHLSKAAVKNWIAVFVSTLLLVVPIAQAGPLTRAELGELFLFGLPGTELSLATTKHLQDTCPGSILLFRRNLVSNRQTQSLILQLRSLRRKCADTPLLVGLDQEGGQVARIPFDPPMPSAWALGATRDPKLAEGLGFEVGQALRRWGVNMDLAPVLDLGRGDRKSFIGSRSFGSDPDQVAEIGSAFSFGLIRARVLPVAKHFPGLGDIPNDPHQEMIRRSASDRHLWQFDLKPFREFTQIFPSAIMPSHLIYPQIDPRLGPGTFSKSLLHTWLRGKLNFHGLVISDDLLMKGAGPREDLGENVVAALTAGVDLVMVSWSANSQARALLAVRQALQDGRLTAQMLREKIERVRKVKRVLGEPALQPKLASNKQLLVMGSPRYADLTYEILKRNIAASPAPVIATRRSGQIYLWPSDFRLQWQLERVLHKRVQPLPKKPLHEDDLIVAIVKTRSEARELTSWSPALKHHVWVINQVEPGAVAAKPFLSKTDLYLQHPMLGSELGKRLADGAQP